MSERSTGIDDADVHDVLRNDRRRRALERLFEADGPVSIGDLSAAVAAAEADEDPPPDDVERSVYVSLYQNHVPKLEQVGIVERDDDNRVWLTDDAARVEGFLRIDERFSRVVKYVRLTALAAGAGLAGAALAAGDVPLVGALPPVAWTVGGLVGALAAALAQWTTYRRSCPTG